MTELTDLGFSKGVIVEAVVSTYNVNGQPNAAPMGVVMDRPQRVVMRIYTSSLTYKNLQSKGCAVVDVTSDPQVFYRTAFKEANPEGRLPWEWFERAEAVNAPRLRMADAHVEVAVGDVLPLDFERAEVKCEVKLVQASKVLPRVYCRASSAVIEAVIHATRVEAFIKDGDRERREQALKLLVKIGECRDVVNRVASNSRYSEVMADLVQRVDSWRVKSESLR